MKYPIFHYEDITYCFVPRDIITDNIYDQLEEILIVGIKVFPLFVFVGTTKCLVYSKNELDDKMFEIKDFIPDKHDIISFSSNDETEYTMIFNKTTKPEFKLQMETILANICDHIEFFITKL